MTKSKRAAKGSSVSSNNQFTARLSKLLKTLKQNSSTLVISAPAAVSRTHDLDYPYRAKSDFYYLTGSVEKGITLVLDGVKNEVFLVSQKPTAHQKLWDGLGETLRSRANKIGATAIESENYQKTVLDLIRPAKKIYVSPDASETPATHIHRLLNSRTAVTRGSLTSCIESPDSLLHPMRLIKDRHEVEAITDSINITIKSIFESLATLQPGSHENIVARTVDYWFGILGATPGFGTIAATGKNAAVLHYTQCKSRLQKDDLLLLDCGAEHNLYSGDITRVFPVNGKFSGVQKDIYQLVLKAQKKAISTVKANVKIKSVYDAAANVMIQGLKDLKVLSGSNESIIKQGKLKKFFPHGIGHSLGLDVHDVGGHRGNNDAALAEGMVFTIEPGLYFSSSVRNIPAMGVRIEDDVLVTKKGCKVLSELMPKETKDIESIMG